MYNYCKYCGYKLYYYEEKCTAECDDCYWGDSDDDYGWHTIFP